MKAAQEKTHQLVEDKIVYNERHLMELINTVIGRSSSSDQNTPTPYAKKTHQAEPDREFEKLNYFFARLSDYIDRPFLIPEPKPYAPKQTQPTCIHSILYHRFIKNEISLIEEKTDQLKALEHAKSLLEKKQKCYADEDSTMNNKRLILLLVTQLQVNMESEIASISADLATSEISRKAGRIISEMMSYSGTATSIQGAIDNILESCAMSETSSQNGAADMSLLHSIYQQLNIIQNQADPTDKTQITYAIKKCSRHLYLELDQEDWNTFIQGTTPNNFKVNLKQNNNTQSATTEQDENDDTGFMRRRKSSSEWDQFTEIAETKDLCCNTIMTDIPTHLLTQEKSLINLLWSCQQYTEMKNIFPGISIEQTAEHLLTHLFNQEDSKETLHAPKRPATSAINLGKLKTHLLIITPIIYLLRSNPFFLLSLNQGMIKGIGLFFRKMFRLASSHAAPLFPESVLASGDKLYDHFLQNEIELTPSSLAACRDISPDQLRQIKEYANPSILYLEDWTLFQTENMALLADEKCTLDADPNTLAAVIKKRKEEKYTPEDIYSECAIIIAQQLEKIIRNIFNTTGDSLCHIKIDNNLMPTVIDYITTRIGLVYDIEANSCAKLLSFTHVKLAEIQLCDGETLNKLVKNSMTDAIEKNLILPSPEENRGPDNRARAFSWAGSLQNQPARPEGQTPTSSIRPLKYRRARGYSLPRALHFKHPHS